MKFAAAVLGAVYLSSASAAEEWVVAPPMKGADKAPTFYVVHGKDPEVWPPDYPLVKVGAPCGAAASPDPQWRLVLGRKGVAVRCEVKK